MNITMTPTDCWTHDPAAAQCRAARRVAPPRRDLRARLLAYAFAALGLALAAYGERYVLADAPAPLVVESSLATCAAELVTGSDAFTATCALPVQTPGATL
jgi:hypothetical protein